jgi:hypothetical protein
LISDHYPKQGGVLKADDLRNGPIDVQIHCVDADRQIRDTRVHTVTFRNCDAKLVLSSTTAHQIAAIHGNDTDQWEGKWVQLYCDPSVMFQNEKVGGIRIRATAPQGNGAVPTSTIANHESESNSHDGNHAVDADRSEQDQ